jgi:hypothetical protein
MSATTTPDKSLVRVAPSTCPGAGNGLFTTRAIPGGDEIVSIPTPLIAIADDAHLGETCAHCLVWKPSSPTHSYYSSPTPLLQCSSCKTVKYCSQACQRASWRYVHKHECKIFSRLYPRILPASVRALLRLLLLEPALPRSTWESIVALQHHGSSFQSTPQWSEITLMAKGAHAYSSTPLPEPLVQRLYCTLLVNTHTLTTATLDPIGMYFHPLSALPNHSCDPNAVITFSGPTLSLRALRPLKEGEEITLTYIDSTQPTPLRQSALRERWFFTCSCALCSAAPNIPQDSLLCPSCRHLTPPPLCSACGGKVPYRPDTEDLGALYRSEVMPVTRHPIPSLHADFVAAKLERGEYAEALPHQLLLVTRIYPALYPQPQHPVRVVAAFTLAALLMEVARDPPETLKRLDVDWGKAVWAVLLEVEAGVWAGSGLADVVKEKKTEVRDELEKAGVEWVKGGKVPGLEQELAKVQVVVEGLVKELKGE